ncbi:MAG: 2-oxoacid:acceptor oxidoreductase subunit alpha, partial [Candidatus Sericytochromatia bacterium]
NMDRLARKFETARSLVPQPVINKMDGAKVGIIAFGSTDLAMQEARDVLVKEGIKTNYLLLKALPLSEEVKKFIEENDVVYVVEQNRDAQLMNIIVMEYRDHKRNLKSSLHYHGMPFDAMSLVESILSQERVAV